MRTLTVLICAVVLGPLAFSQQTTSPTNNPLIHLLQSKGILSADEAAAVTQASSPEESNRRLVQLLVGKGLISQQEYEATAVGSPTSVSQTSVAAELVNTVYRPPQSTQNNPQSALPGPTQASKPEANVIPAVAPLRVLPIDIPKQAGMIPDIKLGSGASMKVYGFFKARRRFRHRVERRRDFRKPGLAIASPGRR